MNDKLIFAKGVTLETLNPYNTALKNTHMNSLLCCAFMVFPRVAGIIGKDRAITIVRGYEAISILKSHEGEFPTREKIKHSRGLAFRFTWDGWTNAEAMLVGRTLYSELPFCPHVVVDVKEKSLYIGFDFHQSALVYRDSKKTTILDKQYPQAAA